MGRPLPPRPASAAVPSSVWRTVDASVVVALPPAALAGGRAGVAAAAAAASLEPALLRYVPPLGGVVVAALPRAGAGRGGASGAGVMAVEPTGHLPAASAYVHVRGRVSLLVFSPPSGALLRGVVNFIAADHIGVSVLRVFHAVIALADAPSSYIPNVAAASWAPSASTIAAGGAPPPVAVGTMVLLSVLDTRHTPAGLFHIRGSLSVPGAGVLPDEDGTADELDWEEADGPESTARGQWVSDAYASFAAEVRAPRPPPKGKELPSPASTTRGKRRGGGMATEEVAGEGNVGGGGADDRDGSGNSDGSDGVSDVDSADGASAAEALAMEGVGAGGEGGWGDALAELGGGHGGAGNV